ncbi:lipopolysaccharide heptosyltransferase II, partial [Sodalis-like symbiont of Bactericera trigonica]
MKILVIGPSWVGDMMMSQSLYRLLAQHHPGVQIDVMAPAWCRPLLNRMPEVSQALAMPLRHGALALGERRRLGQSLRQSGYQQALVLPNSLKSALVTFFADIPHRTGWRGEMRYGLLNDLRTLDKQAFPLMVQRYAALAFDRRTMRSAADLPTPLPWPRLTVSAAEKAQALSTFVPDETRPLIGFCPGAEFGPAKRWPHYHYAALAEALIRRGYQIALFGLAKDHAAGEAIGAVLTAGA